MSYFQSRRSAIVARRGAVATSQPQAALVGLRFLQEGGHAVDAAVATAAALNVLEPGSTGVGGDMFALVWDNAAKKVIAINGSGRAAAAASPDDVARKGYSAIPLTGPDAGLSVSVPGTVGGWQALLERCGRMTLRDVLQPAIRYAREGYGVTEVIAEKWGRATSLLQQRPSGNELLSDGRAPKYGDIIRLEALANTLEAIAEGGSDAFYHGDIAGKIAAFVQQNGGWLTEKDLAANRSDWDEPISTEYRGVTIYECPPNGQGITALMALNIAEGFDVGAMGPQSTDRYHYLVESLRLAFADAFEYVADPRVSPVPTTQLLDKSYADERRTLISPDRAMEHAPHGNPLAGSDTVYLSVVDGEGNACSFINSVFTHFGSGLVVPGTGIALHNRGALFSLDPSHLNYLQGGKRPYQTIIPGMATRDGELWLSFGVMGGFQQPQGHLQVISNMVDFSMDPQQALNALRFCVDVEGGTVSVEEDLPESTVIELRQRGHPVVVVGGYGRTMFGGGQVIQRDPDTGVIIAGSEPRSDGVAVGW